MPGQAARVTFVRVFVQEVECLLVVEVRRPRCESDVCGRRRRYGRCGDAFGWDIGVGEPVAVVPFLGVYEADDEAGEGEEDEEGDEAEDEDVDVEDEVEVVELDGLGGGGRGRRGSSLGSSSEDGRSRHDDDWVKERLREGETGCKQHW